MGEYASYNGEKVKIGTCEDMLYLRADQAHLVQPLSGNVNPQSADEQQVIRFRFPWPDEDAIEPGAFDDPFRHAAIPGVKALDGVDHGSVQFSSTYPRKGYLLSIPCPEGPHAQPTLSVGKNGWSGDVLLVQQAYRGDGELRIICECGGCGAKYSVPPSEIEAYIVACRAEADRRIRDNQMAQNRADIAKSGERFNLDPSLEWWNIVADRIAAGYGLTADERAVA